MSWLCIALRLLEKYPLHVHVLYMCIDYDYDLYCLTPMLLLMLMQVNYI